MKRFNFLFLCLAYFCIIYFFFVLFFIVWLIVEYVDFYPVFCDYYSYLLHKTILPMLGIGQGKERREVHNVVVE